MIDWGQGEWHHKFYWFFFVADKISEIFWAFSSASHMFIQLKMLSCIESWAWMNELLIKYLHEPVEILN